MSTIQTSEIIKQLNTLLATSVQFYFAYKYFHWHVVGQGVYSFHLMFDKHASIIYDTWDIIAERIRQMQGTVEANLSQLQQEGQLQPFESGITRNIQAYILPYLLQAHTTTIKLLEDIIDKTSKVKDFSTADLLTAILEGQQQMEWFVRSSKE